MVGINRWGKTVTVPETLERSGNVTCMFVISIEK